MPVNSIGSIYTVLSIAFKSILYILVELFSPSFALHFNLYKRGRGMTKTNNQYAIHYLSCFLCKKLYLNTFAKM